MKGQSVKSERVMNRSIVSILFLIVLLACSASVYADDPPSQDSSETLSSVLECQTAILQELRTVVLFQEQQWTLLRELYGVGQYQLGLLSLLSGALLAFVFLYGLRLR